MLRVGVQRSVGNSSREPHAHTVEPHRSPILAGPPRGVWGGSGSGPGDAAVDGTFKADASETGAQHQDVVTLGEAGRSGDAPSGLLEGGASSEAGQRDGAETGDATASHDGSKPGDGSAKGPDAALAEGGSGGDARAADGGHHDTGADASGHVDASSGDSGHAGEVRSYNGLGWSSQPIPAGTPDLYAVYAAPSGKVFPFGRGGTILIGP